MPKGKKVIGGIFRFLKKRWIGLALYDAEFAIRQRLLVAGAKYGITPEQATEIADDVIDAVRVKIGLPPD